MSGCRLCRTTLGQSQRRVGVSGVVQRCRQVYEMGAGSACKACGTLSHQAPDKELVVGKARANEARCATRRARTRAR